MRGRVWLIAIASITAGAVASAAPPNRECHAEANGLVCGYRCLKSAGGHWSCANAPSGSCRRELDGAVICTQDPNAAPLRGQRLRRNAECLKGRDGHVACGYWCFENLARHPICAQTPDGMCLMDHERVLCSEVDAAPWLIRGDVLAECIKDRAGQLLCGYRCRLGTDGVALCAQTPDGACDIDDFGHAVCTLMAPDSRRVELASFPGPDCAQDRTGAKVCGYQCLPAADGTRACATTPDGACGVDGAGHVICTQFPMSTRARLVSAGSARH